MQRILTRYSRTFNIRHHRIGHLFQGRYKAILCQKDSYLLELLRYIHLNPLRANMVKSASDWPWSSHNEYLGLRENPMIDLNFPLSLFNQNIVQARSVYAQFITSASAPAQELFNTTPAFPCLGDAAFEDRIREQFFTAEPTNEENPKASLLDLGRTISNKTGVSLAAIQKPIRLLPIVRARHLLILLAIDRGFKPSNIAAFLSCSVSSISKSLTRLGR